MYLGLHRNFSNENHTTSPFTDRIWGALLVSSTYPYDITEVFDIIYILQVLLSIPQKGMFDQVVSMLFFGGCRSLVTFIEDWHRSFQSSIQVLLPIFCFSFYCHSCDTCRHNGGLKSFMRHVVATLEIIDRSRRDDHFDTH